jgi:hypothetical protein
MFLQLSIRQQAILWIAFPSTLSSFRKMLILLLSCYIIILLLSKSINKNIYKNIKPSRKKKSGRMVQTDVWTDRVPTFGFVLAG